MLNKMKIKICLIGLYLTIFNNVCAMSSNTYSFEGNKLTLILAEKKDNFLDLGLYFQLQPGWKIYWVYPGDAGSPPKIKVEDKKLFKSHRASTRLSLSKKKVSPDLMS